MSRRQDPKDTGRDRRSCEAALSKAVALSYSVLADEVEHGERDARSVLNITFETPAAA